MHTTPMSFFEIMLRIIKLHKSDPQAAARENLRYWLSRPPGERVAAVDFLRAQLLGTGHRLQAVARVVRRERPVSE